jgi:hypothetical protein
MTILSAFAGNSYSRILTGIAVGDFVGFIWIQPNLLLAAFQYGGCQPLLKLEGTKILKYE